MFQSTPSKRKETWPPKRLFLFKCVSIHSFQAEGDLRTDNGQVSPVVVSIHSFQAEGDICRTTKTRIYKCFNPLLPSGRRPQRRDAQGRITSFQSTPSKRKETVWRYHVQPWRRCFNPLLPSGRRLKERFILLRPFPFQSTPSKRKETHFHFAHLQDWYVSIHSFQAEGDGKHGIGITMEKCFNPLLPSGRRPSAYRIYLTPNMFQSTPSKRKETKA